MCCSRRRYAACNACAGQPTMCNSCASNAAYACANGPACAGGPGCTGNNFNNMGYNNNNFNNGYNNMGYNNMGHNHNGMGYNNGGGMLVLGRPHHLCLGLCCRSRRERRLERRLEGRRPGLIGSVVDMAVSTYHTIQDQKRQPQQPQNGPGAPRSLSSERRYSSGSEEEDQQRRYRDQAPLPQGSSILREKEAAAVAAHGVSRWEQEPHGEQPPRYTDAVKTTV